MPPVEGDGGGACGDEPPLPRGPLRPRLVTLEAAALLLAARLLIAVVRFGRWRPLLGRPAAAAPAPAPGPASADARPAAPAPLDRYLARAVDRAADRLPLRLVCLPRAMALHWMLRRRRRRSHLVIAALPQDLRGNADALHAWVESDGAFLIGRPDPPHRPLLRLSFD